MFICVDYDNLPREHRHKGPKYVVERVLRSIGTRSFSADNRAKVRLYGGWYDCSNPTRRCQKLSGELQASFPGVIPVTDQSGAVPVRVAAELAYSLAADPHRHLFHTFRRRGMPQGLRCDDPGNHGCVDSSCPLKSLPHFINQGKCPKQGCSVRPEDLLYRNQQKLVDTMLSADVIHYATSGVSELCIVSSDDDFWPAIRSALLAGAQVIHVHTKPRHTTPAAYCRGVGPDYVQNSL